MSENTIYDVRLATLGALGGDTTKTYNSLYDVEVAIKKQLEEGGTGGLKPEVVTELPETGEENKLYFVPNEEAGEKDNYKEYVWVNGAWECVGNAAVDLSDYATKDYVLDVTKYTDYLCFTALADSTIKLQQVGTPTKYTTYELYTSTDTVTWTPYTLGTTISIAKGSKLYWKGNNTSMAESGSIYKQFVMTDSIAASGNCNSILGTNTLTDYCYYNLFYNCTSLTTAPELPTTTLTNSCYSGMFYNCTSLKSAPELPAKKVGTSCYESMFYNCTSLKSAPELPATTIGYHCYYYMLSGCTSLITAPTILPATSLPIEPYELMFYGCTSLITAPVLPATTLTQGCYESMFKNCTSLITAPELPATTLGRSCYENMFEGCKSLVNPPSVLPATNISPITAYTKMFSGCSSLKTTPIIYAETMSGTGCFKEMFASCTSLNRVIIYAKSWNTSLTSNWLFGVQTTGTFIKPIDTNIPDGTSGIPSGWTVMYVGADVTLPYATATYQPKGDYLTSETAAETYQEKGDYALESELDDYLTSETAAETYQPIGTYAKVVTLTQAEYDALETKDATTLYIISDATDEADDAEATNLVNEILS